LRPHVFDRIVGADMSPKKRTESTFAYLNRSARPGSTECRALIEKWLSRLPAVEHAHFCSRFRCGNDVEFNSAIQELTIHELLCVQGCKLHFHPEIPGTTKQPDFKIREPGRSEFLLEACTSAEISSGPNGGPRANRIRDFLQDLNLGEYLLGIDELTEGSRDLSQKLLARHIETGIKGAVGGYVADSISIPLLTTADGWRIRLTAFRKAKYGPRRHTVMQEVWGRTWKGPSYPLRDSLRKKAGRYGRHFAMPYVIAANSFDVMLTNTHFGETLFGILPQATGMGHCHDTGLWGTASAPNHRRVSAVLFTSNLWPATLLVHQVYACLYLNPWAAQPYDGVLTKLPTFRFEEGELREHPGVTLPKLLKLRRRCSTLWE